MQHLWSNFPFDITTADSKTIVIIAAHANPRWVSDEAARLSDDALANKLVHILCNNPACVAAFALAAGPRLTMLAVNGEAVELPEKTNEQQRQGHSPSAIAGRRTRHAPRL